ncbi:MAG: hypothetical protein HY046_06405 [Acidobacteria bacterium]|nr:hypothetical protein [Acidobacteriota bacterium]
MKLIFSGLLFLSIWVVGARETRAQCDCGGYAFDRRGYSSDRATKGCGGIRSRYETAYEELTNAEVVFTGRVIETRKVTKLVYTYGDRDELEIRFQVIKVWKKGFEEFVSVRETVDSCLFPFEAGKEYLVYAVADGKVLRTWYCSRTRLVSEANKDLKEFRKKGVRPEEIARLSPPKK